MSTAKHTPGPWKLQLGKGLQYDYIVRSSKEGPIACFAHYKQFTKKATKANARLMAAAPEMLDCLRQLLAIYGVNDRDEPYEDGECHSIDAVRAVIAKATGETP